MASLKNHLGGYNIRYLDDYGNGAERFGNDWSVSRFFDALMRIKYSLSHKSTGGSYDLSEFEDAGDRLIAADPDAAFALCFEAASATSQGQPRYNPTELLKGAPMHGQMFGTMSPEFGALRGGLLQAMQGDTDTRKQWLKENASGEMVGLYIEATSDKLKTQLLAANPTRPPKRTKTKSEPVQSGMPING